MDYGQEYFNYQKNIGAFGGLANLFKFEPYIRPTDVVLDFGCGGGYLLHNLANRRKAGIEINDAAREQALRFGLTVYQHLNEVADGFADVVISNHALEHVERPLDVLRDLRPKIRLGGRIIFVVPHQKPDEAYVENDPNQHLYTWNPLTLGNLMRAAGYVHIQTDVIQHAWPPNYADLYARWGQRVFDIIARQYAHFKRIYQIRGYAERGD